MRLNAERVARVNTQDAMTKKRWLELAWSIEFGEQLDSFTQNSAEPNHPNL